MSEGNGRGPLLIVEGVSVRFGALMALSRVCTQFQRLSSKIRSSGTSRQIHSSRGLIRETRRPVAGSLV